MSRVATAEASTGALSSCISSESLHFVLGTDCLFCNVKHRVRRRGKRKSDAVSAVSPCRILFFFFFLTFILSDRQSLSGRCHPAACWRGSKTLGRSRRIIVQPKKKKRKIQKKWKKCCFEQVSFGLTNKNIPVKRARLPAFS